MNEEVPLGCNLGKALPSRTSRRFVVPAIVGEGHAPPGAALPFGTGHHENVTHPRLVIARSEATWQSRSTRPDPRKTIGEIVTAFPRLPRPLRGLAMTSRGRLPFYRHPVPAVSAPPGPAVRSPAMACAINVTAFPRSSRARSALAMRSRGLSPDFEFLTPR